MEYRAISTYSKKKVCENCRGINTLNIAYKVLFYILQPYHEKVIGNYQDDFCRDEPNENQIETHHLFVDVEIADDSVFRSIRT